ncbi:MAG: SUMF1/EgtB/PvdO family nonheme iron enzyme [Labilithrix sp.]
MRRTSLALLLAAIAAACSPAVVRPPATKAAARASAQPRVDRSITNEGGVVAADGATLTIPSGAVQAEKTYSVELVTDAELAELPGSAAGYRFEPAGQSFRIPVEIQLLADGPTSEVMCESVSGERWLLPPEAAVSDAVYHFHVTELPRRCVIFTAAHASALQSSTERHGQVVEKQNQRHKWEVQSEVCNPHIFLRPNSGKPLQEPPGIGGCPPGMAPIPGKQVCIDRWEAHVLEVLDDGTTHTWSPYFNPGAIKIKARSTPGAVPQGYISQVQAKVACEAAGKRLCTDAEWVTACRGSQNTQFPYGNDEKRGVCNDHRDRHPAIEYLESTDVYSRLEHPCINQIPNSVFPTGTMTECHTTDGVFDMIGNLHEWTADPAGTFRGGYYVEAKLNGRGCDYATTRHDAIYWDYSVGFRCCAKL